MRQLIAEIHILLSFCRVSAASFCLAALLTGSPATVHGQSALDGFAPNANGDIRVAVIQADGKILLGGTFTAVAPNGVAATRNRIVRLNPDGTVDVAFNPDANG